GGDAVRRARYAVHKRGPGPVALQARLPGSGGIFHWIWRPGRGLRGPPGRTGNGPASLVPEWSDNMAALVDRFGRSFPYLRLSLTEACNYRCSYCVPDGYQADGRPRFLELDEVRRLVRGFAALGMSRIRLTGGEPTLRKDLLRIIAAV